jgi:hypothetical protein
MAKTDSNHTCPFRGFVVIERLAQMLSSMYFQVHEGQGYKPLDFYSSLRLGRGGLTKISHPSPSYWPWLLWPPPEGGGGDPLVLTTKLRPKGGCEKLVKKRP